MKWRERQEQEAYEAQVSAVLDVDTFYHGVVVNGIDLGGMTMDEAREALTTEEQNAEQPFSITLTYNDQSFTITQDDVDHSVDTDAVLETAYEYGRTGTREERYEQVTALEETPVEYTLSAEMGEASLRAALEDDDRFAQTRNRRMLPSRPSMPERSSLTLRTGRTASPWISTPSRPT